MGHALARCIPLVLRKITARLRRVWIRGPKGQEDALARTEILNLLKAVYHPWSKNDRIILHGRKGPITVGMSLNVTGYDVMFVSTFEVIKGAPCLLEEIVDVKGVVRLEEKGRSLRIRHDDAFLDRALEEVEEVLAREEAGEQDDVVLPLELKRRLAEGGREALADYTVEVGRWGLGPAFFLNAYGCIAAACYLKTVTVLLEGEGRAVIFSPKISRSHERGEITVVCIEPLLWKVRDALRSLLKGHASPSEVDQEGH